MNKKVTFIDTLTPLRGLAAIWVVVFHFDEFLGGGQGNGFFNRDSTMLIGNGYLLVDFFFVLSGFVICHVYGDQLAQGFRSSKVRKYLWARFSRLYPLHLFALLYLFSQFLFFAYFSPEYEEGWSKFFKPYDFVVYLLLGQSSGVLSNYSWNLPSWSIAAEWWTYILAIFIIPYINKGFSKVTYLFWALSIAGLIILVYVGGKGNLDYTLNFGTLRCLFEFTIGLGVYQVYKSIKDTQTFWKSDWAFVLAVAASYLFLHLDINDVLVVVCFGGVILSASLNKGKAAALLNIKPLKFLGDISYSVYLLQLFWLLLWRVYLSVNYPDGVTEMSTKLIMLFVLLTLLIINSYLTYRFIEKPCQRILRRGFSKKEKVVVDAAIETPKD